MKPEYEILGIYIKEPEQAYNDVQSLMTSFGCIIRTRLGVNRKELNGGIIILDITGDDAQKQLFRRKLEEIQGVEIQEMSF
ncbi:MAG: hypothetical protein GX879_00640 [Bacteroidales bacterium]|nr:hypothetical protein [Bacteroidales bacterium]